MKTSKNLVEMSNAEMKKANGGAIASLIIAGMAIAGPFAQVAWDIGQGLGKIFFPKK